MIYLSMTEDELVQLEKNAVYSDDDGKLFATRVLRALLQLKIVELTTEKNSNMNLINVHGVEEKAESWTPEKVYAEYERRQDKKNDIK